MDRAGVFIDGSNFFHACRENLGRSDVDLGKLASWLVGPQRRLIRTYYYTCPVPSDAPEALRVKQQRFFGALARIPYFEVRTGRLAKRQFECADCRKMTERYVEKGIDMHIGVDMLSMVSRNLIDVPILVSGDGDLSSAIKAVKDLGKHTELATLPRGRSWELVQAADIVHQLDPASMRQFYLRP